MRLYTVTLLVLVLFYRPSYGILGWAMVNNALTQLDNLMKENMRILINHDQWQLRWSAKDAQYYESIDNMHKRIAGIEFFMTKIEEGGRINLQQTANMVNNLEANLLSVVNRVESKLSSLLNRPVTILQPPVQDRTTEIINKLSNTEAVLANQVAQLKVESNSMNIKLKDDSTTQSEKIQVVSGQLFNIAGRIEKIENSVRALEKASQGVKECLQKPFPDPRPAIEEQTRTLNNLKKLLEETSDRIQKTPIAKEVTNLHTGTLAALQKSTDAINSLMTREVSGVKDQIVKFKDETANSVSQLRSDLEHNTVGVKEKLHDFGKGQSMMADEVLDAKKRVDNGVHEIVAKFGDLVKSQGNDINNMHERFDGISNYIMVNQSAAVANLTTKMEQEMYQVWRQVNGVCQQMTESAKALDKIHRQDAAYVTCTTSMMGGVENKVGEVTKRMAKLDENLNSLMGSLSLVTQKINGINSGLGPTLGSGNTVGPIIRRPRPVLKNWKEPEKTEVMQEITGQ